MEEERAGKRAKGGDKYGPRQLRARSVHGPLVMRTQAERGRGRAKYGVCVCVCVCMGQSVCVSVCLCVCVFVYGE